jgi:hypothetical protein
MGCAKVIQKKKGKKGKKRGVEKNRQVSEVLETMGTQMPAEKRRR